MTGPGRGRERFELFAAAAPGLEPLVAEELAELGAHGSIEEGGVAFTGGVHELAVASAALRIASRITVRIARFHAESFPELERHANRVPWNRFLGAGRAPRFRVTCRKSRLYHSDAVAQRVARAAGVGIVKTDRAAGGEGGGDDGESSARQLFVVRLLHDECTISADASGELLHRRGWRQAVGKAPLRETLAAAMLRASGWTGDAPLVDPFCGSGTIPIEGALIARRLPPGANRDFAFLHWPGVDAPAARSAIRALAAAGRPRAGAAILGADRDAGAIEAATANADRAGVASDVRLINQPLSALRPPDATGWLVSNPPYGVRVGDRRALRDLYARLGHVARGAFDGWRVVLLSADPALERATGLGFDDLFRTTNGGIPVRCVIARG